MFAIRYFVLFALRYSVLFANHYSLFGIASSNYMNNEYSIALSFFGKYFEFCKPFVNFIVVSFDNILLSISIKSCEKANPGTLLSLCNVALS